MDTIFILLWTSYTYPFFYIEIGKTFHGYGCETNNCILIDDEDWVGGDFSKIHAVFFNIRNLYEPDCYLLPQRYSHQKYILISTEPYEKHNFKDSRYNGFFNWTATYRLDSDIPYPFVGIKDLKGNIVGPKIDMHWEKDMKDNNDESLISRLKNKTKAAAWFVSHCNTTNKRREYVEELKFILSRYSLGVDIYGLCGDLKCPKNGDSRVESYYECHRMIGREYFFYLAFENTFLEDYVTEKLLTAVNNYVVPVVYGGANYSRFLPPNSYLDARKHTPDELGFIMKELIQNPSMYRRFFKWKSYYSYHDAIQTINICTICAALNNKTKFEAFSVYENITAWMNR